ncbi:hypothetical protein [Ilumatobacter sp.]|uniref:hypothetical protein n=1 Tax=Ilumatobacter sp. TaxID=1967498 RepID=UPI0030AA418E
MAAVMAVLVVDDQEGLRVEAVTAAAVPMAGATAAVAVAMNVEAVPAVVMIASRKTVHH